MKLDRVTITGADDSVKPSDLYDLSRRFQFVEWGILVSKNSAGTRRFPSPDWITSLMGPAYDIPMRFSMHVCGSWLRRLLTGHNEIAKQLLCYDFQRVQLNFHAEDLPVDEGRLADVLFEAFGKREIIFQIDGNRGQEYLAIVGDGKQAFTPLPLFDCSHGAGVLAKEWPKPFDVDTYHGYAGGLGPDNLADQIPLIAQAAGAARFWIDMETRVRSNSDQQFDLAKVEECLTICAPFVESARGS
ncbi:MAG TPA: hypothetical protein VMV98_05955 [Acidobacteriaceae bacterium]|nr:hypothetical protein [Acidobacteriaceae bacterium]